jgi:aminopeptidase N
MALHPRPLATSLAAILAAAALATGTCLPATAAPGDPVAGGSSAGDPYFPGLGNTGYDARKYHLDLTYAPGSRSLHGTATVTLRTHRALSSFNLDLRDLTVSRVRVNGERAAFEQADGELTITPQRPLRKHRTAVARIRYGGTTGRPVDNTDSLFGWVSTADGAVVASEAYGAPTWYPVNDTPTDKALYSFEVTVPKGKSVVANGLPVGRPTTRHGWTTSRWAERSPMASYLATVDIGDWRITRDRTRSGLPVINAVDRDLSGEARRTTTAALAKQERIIRFFSSRFGPYPFTSTGAIVDDDSDLGYALETQSRPYYSGRASEGTVAHELAHQWYGDSVTPELWKDIWLNEGFATYAEWMWEQHTGDTPIRTNAEAILDLPADSEVWALEPGDPGAPDLFASAVYARGALTLFELHRRIGGATFARLLRSWATIHAHDNASPADFVRLAERLSGKELSPFFHTWLYTTGKPTHR